MGYSEEFKMRVVRTHIVDGISQPALSQALGIPQTTISSWVSTYRAHPILPHALPIELKPSRSDEWVDALVDDMNLAIEAIGLMEVLDED